MNFKKYKNLIIGNISIFVSLYFLISIFSDQFNIFDNLVLDKKYNLKKYFDLSPKMSSNIIHINIDDYSKTKNKNNYYWSKKNDSQIFKKLSKEDSGIILCDILYTNKQDTTGNHSLVSSINECGNVISPFVVNFNEQSFVENHNRFYTKSGLKFNPKSSNNFLRINEILYSPINDIVKSSYGYGYVNLQNNKSFIDITIREIPIVSKINDVIIPSIVLETLLAYLDVPIDDVKFEKNRIIINDILYENENRNFVIPIDTKGFMKINYSGSYNKNNYPNSFSASDYIHKNNNLDFNNKFVIVSDISAESHDIIQTPFNQLPGSYILSNALNTILSQEYLKDINLIFECIFLIISLFIISYFSIHLSGLIFIFFSIFYILLCFILSFYIFIYLNIIFPIFKLTILVVGSIIFSGAWKFAIIEKEIGELEGSLKSYLSPPLLEKIKKNPDLLKMGGDRKNISVIFTDIVGFTEFCDKSEPEDVQIILTEYLEIFAKVIFKYGGVIDKYLGDGILAFFENENEENISSLNAIKCAIELQEKSKTLNEKFLKQNKLNFHVRIGIATGYAKVGNIGPKEKIDYTIIGSVVNLASRLESLASINEIVIDEETYFFVKNKYKVIDSDKVKIKGFREEIKIYKLKV